MHELCSENHGGAELSTLAEIKSKIKKLRELEASVPNTDPRKVTEVLNEAQTLKYTLLFEMIKYCEEQDEMSEM